MGSETKPALLNSSQIRAVGATLRLVERLVEEIEGLLTEPARGITFRFADDLDAEERRAIQSACDRVRRSLAEASQRLGAEVAERSRRREIRGKVSTVWANLEDTKSPALRGYGPLPPDAGRTVDETLDEISGLLVGILRLAADHRPRAGTQE
jgi:hypothetical protein